jgi:hypothetical protein
MKALSLFVVVLMLTPVFAQEVPDAPKPAPVYAPQEPHILPYYTVLPAPKHHNWAYRHPIIVGAIAGGTFGLVWGLTHTNSCPSYINGVPYNGTKPCPKSCEGPGDCYWGPRK